MSMQETSKRLKIIKRVMNTTGQIVIAMLLAAYGWIFSRMNKRIDLLETADKQHDLTLTEIKVSLAEIQTDLKYLIRGRDT